jgi:hypothetical protein
MASGKELLEQQHEEERKKAGIPLANINGSTPAPLSEVDRIKAETERIRATTEQAKAQQALDAQTTGFISAEEYLKGIATLHREQQDWVQTKAVENSTIEKIKAELSASKDQLQLGATNLKLREDNVGKREKLCSEREASLGAAQKVAFDREAEYSSDRAIFARNFMFVRNRLVRICKELWDVGDSYGDSLATNIKVLDKQGGDLSNLNGKYNGLLSNLRTVTADTYDVITGLMRTQVDTTRMTQSFEELSQNEIWKLIKPSAWIQE